MGRYTCIVEPLLPAVCGCLAAGGAPPLRRGAARAVTRLLLAGFLRLRTPLYYRCGSPTDLCDDLTGFRDGQREKGERRKKTGQVYVPYNPVVKMSGFLVRTATCCPPIAYEAIEGWGMVSMRYKCEQLCRGRR